MVQLAVDRTSLLSDYSPHKSTFTIHGYSTPSLPSPWVLHLKPPYCSWITPPLRLQFTYNPLKHLSCTTCVHSFPVYTTGTIAIHLDVSKLHQPLQVPIATTFPTSPKALPCNTSIYQASSTMAHNSVLLVGNIDLGEDAGIDLSVWRTRLSCMARKRLSCMARVTYTVIPQ